MDYATLKKKHKIGIHWYIS